MCGSEYETLARTLIFLLRCLPIGSSLPANSSTAVLKYRVSREGNIVSFLDGYEAQFGNRVSKFVEVEVPRVLDSLDEQARSHVIEGTGNFPKDIIQKVLASNVEEQQKIYDIVVIAGTWMNASSGTRWAVGPLNEEPYAEGVGIGLEDTSKGAFTPLLAHIEDLISDEASPSPDKTSVLDRLAAFAEFDKKWAAEEQ